MRNKIIAGNWKMNKTPEDAKQYFNEFIELVEKASSDIAICVPFVDLQTAIEMTKDSNIKIGAQNMYYEKQGAFTGEISPEMLKSLNVEYVILGHSERRQYFNETDELINLKLKSALNYGLNAIVCVGETLEQRQKGIQNDVISYQVKKVLKDIEKEDMDSVIIAYEPIWAIGTGKTATSIDANNACILIRNEITEIFGVEISKNVRIIYGGSVKPSNAKELFTMPDIDGGLVGGCSLESQEFGKIVNYDKE